MWKPGREVPCSASEASHTAVAFARSLELEAKTRPAWDQALAWDGSPTRVKLFKEKVCHEGMQMDW